MLYNLNVPTGVCIHHYNIVSPISTVAPKVSNYQCLTFMLYNLNVPTGVCIHHYNIVTPISTVDPESV